MPSNALAYSTPNAETPLAKTTIKRKDVEEDDVEIKITHCGVCHSDLHTARNEWHNTLYPCVPGHEIIGKVVSVGSNVTKFHPGQTVGVGCFIGSCGKCEDCKDGLQQYCNGLTMTYNSKDSTLDTPTFGGYSSSIVVTQSFVLRIPENLDPAAAAPLLCAGITTYSPLRNWKVSSGQTVGVMGLGGLGHMGVKFAKAMGARVILFTTSASKIADGKRLGADEVVLSKDKDQMEAHNGTLDFLLNTIANVIDLAPYFNLLKRDGALVQVGAPGEPQPVNVFGLIFKRRTYAGSLVGGIPETAEMLEFCGKHNIVSDVEVIKISEINEAYERMLKGDVKYRFVIDMSSLN